MLVVSAVISLIAALPLQSFAQAERGIELYNSGNFEEAEKALRQVLIKANSAITPANYYLGLSILGQKRYEEALDIFLEVKKSQDKTDQQVRPAVPSEYQIQLALGRARLGLGQFDEAWRNLEAARTEDGSASDVYVYRGVFYLEQKKYDKAIESLEKAISLDDQNAYAYYYAGMAYYRSGNGKKAAEDLKTFIKLAPDAPEVDQARETINMC
jgi:tetratricopeptide (TPR) repeat protein